MNIEFEVENKNKLRFVDNYGETYESEVIYNTTTKEFRFRCDYADAELYMSISLFNEISNIININKQMED